MKILLVYASTEGQTQKVAGFVADRLSKMDHRAQVVNATDAAAATLDPKQFDAVIIAGSVHAGHYQASILHFVKRNLPAIDSRPNAFLSVSLAAASDDKDDIDGIRHCVDAFIEQTGWRPKRIHHVAGAFRYTSYDFLKRWAMKYIAHRKGAPTDTRRDYELTDWADLARFVDSFLKCCAGGEGRRSAELAPASPG
jgi:menaquinone-dependent protoporphyrinogen oxidase